GAMNVMLGQFEAAVSDANAGLKIDPNYYELLFMKATVFVVLEKELDEIINAYQTFLALAPKDHLRVPESYYSMACRYVECSDDDDLIEETYKQGEEAEKIQLPCFLPYKSDNKMALKSAFEDECSPDVIPVLVPDRRSRLTDLHRIDIFKRHRQWSASMSSNKNAPIGITQKPRVKQPTSKSLIGLKSISLREINPTKDHVYNGYVLSVTIIDEALSWRPSIHLVIEDENYDCDHMVVYDFQDTQGKHLINEVFTIGTKMSIINPYLRIGANDGKPFIRVDDFSSIIFQHESERVVNMCRCCGQSNASHVCSRCKRARYCTKECQIMDWKLYEHKLLCIDRSYREKSLTLDGSVTQKFDGQQESTSEASQLCLPLIPIDAAQNDIRVQTSSLFLLAPAYQEKNVPLGSSVWMASNSVHLLMKRDNHLCLLDQNLNVVKKTPWASDEHV
ncbi:unnamed protein product, partial [Adineta steineri]